jgi:hypothetical protein
MLLRWGWAFDCKRGKVGALDRTFVGGDNPVEDTWVAVNIADWRRDFGLGQDRLAGDELLPHIVEAAVLGYLEGQGIAIQL